MKTLLNNKLLTGSLLLLAGLFLGWLFFSPGDKNIATEEHEHTAEVWTCSMHPSVRQSEPGKCPICGMDLIPLEDMGDSDDPMEVKMSETAIRLANIQTMKIETGNVVKEVRLNGKIQPDERKISSQPSHIPGRIEQLMVNFTGEFVQRGKVIAYVYSPDLVTAQRELLEAHKIRESQPALYSAAREKLKNWKITDKQIDDMITSQKLTERFPIVANVSGVVRNRNVNVGDYVSKGTSIYEVADLSSVWILFDVYESDMPWIKTGSQVEFTVQSLPGEKFMSRITFVDPILDPKTRVSKARAEMKNATNKFKPEMFVSGIVKSEIKQGGEIALPKSAVMWTGERSIVYLKKQSAEGVSFRLHEVVLGPSLGDSYVITSGLKPGMEVVVNGTFTIDAAAQLSGKPSMMNADYDEASSGPQAAPAEFKSQLRILLAPYLRLKDALVETDATVAAKEAKELLESLSMFKSVSLDEQSMKMWTRLLDKMLDGAREASSSNDVEEQRKSLWQISEAYHEAITIFGLTGLAAYYQYCPMAFDDAGAYWISKEKDIRNPYFGSKMLRCGETREELN